MMALYRINIGSMSIAGIISNVRKMGTSTYYDVITSIGEYSVFKHQISELPEGAYDNLEEKLINGYQSAILTNKYDKPVHHMKHNVNNTNIFYKTNCLKYTPDEL